MSIIPAMSDPEKTPEINGIGPERTGNGTFDDGWRPGVVDPNQEIVRGESDPKKPGIVLPRELVDVGGMILNREVAEAMGLVQGLPPDAYTHARRLGVRPKSD